MIRVNLLPVKERKRAKKPAAATKIEIPVAWIAIGLVFVLINVAGAFLYHKTLQAKADSIQQQIVDVEQAIERLKLDIRKVEEAKQKKTQLEQKINIIKTLKEGKTGPVRLMDELARSVPERLWLTDMSENGAKVQMNGLALGDEEIAQFMKNLEGTSVFHSVELTQVTQEARQGFAQGLKGFQLSANIRYTSAVR